MVSVELALAEVHLGVRLHELLQLLLLLHLVACGQTLLLLTHIEYYLLRC